MMVRFGVRGSRDLKKLLSDYVGLRGVEAEAEVEAGVEAGVEARVSEAPHG